MKSELGSVTDRSGRALVRRIERPRAFMARARGLLGRASLNAEEGLWIDRCSSIHMFGMRFEIDVVFLRHGQVMRLCRGVRPLRMRWCARADTTLELAAGTIDRLGLCEQQVLEFRSAA